MKKVRILELPVCLLDIVILIFVSLILLVLATGGGIYDIRPGFRIRVHQITNPLLVLYILLIIRLWTAKRIPFLGRRALDISRLSDQAAIFWNKVGSWFRELTPAKAGQIVLIIIGVSVVIKILNAFFYFGFFSGDDVEIHEFSFAHLFHWNWKAWNLRSPFFPMVFIYPIQFILHTAGVQDPWLLIFAGRLVVIAFSALNLLLVYKLARRIFSSVPVAVLSVFFLAMSKLHTAFASTELPRTVASFFVLLGCWFLFSEKKAQRNAVLSGISLGIGAALRFSEVIFVVPAILFLVFRRRWRQALVLAVAFVAILLAILGVCDELYWKTPWLSLRNVVDFTLVKKMSTRGYESPLYYLLSVGIWSDYLTIALACFALRLRNRMVWLWAFSPLILLSFIPHKEPRYLVPSIPFFALMAGLSAWHFLKKNEGAEFKIYIPKRLSSFFFVLSFLAFLAVLLSSKDNRFAFVAIPSLSVLGVLYAWFRNRSQEGGANDRLRTLPVRLGLPLFVVIFFMAALEIDGYRLRRTEAGVEMARLLARQADLRGVAIEEIWRVGGRLYLWKIPTVMNIDEVLLLHPDRLLQEVKMKGIRAIGLREEHVRSLKYDDLLRSCGFIEVPLTKKKRLYQYRLFLKR